MDLRTRRSRESCEEVERTVVAPSSTQPSKFLLGVATEEKFAAIREIIEKMTVDELSKLGAGAYVGWVIYAPSLRGIPSDTPFTILRLAACEAPDAEFTWGFLLPRSIRRIKQILTDESTDGGTALLLGNEREDWAPALDNAFGAVWGGGHLLILSISGDPCILAGDEGLVVRHGHAFIRTASKIPIS